MVSPSSVCSNTKKLNKKKMKQWFDKLNIFYKCGFLSAIFLIIISLSLIPLYFVGWQEIPLGILLGLGYGSIIYILFGYIDNKKKNGYFLMIMVSIFRYFIFAIILILIALCYYVWGIRYFNLIAYAGGYLINTIIFVILYFLENRKAKTNE